MKRILALSVSAGAGHVRAAQALVAAAPGRGDVEVVHADVLDFVPTAFRRLYGEFYLDLVGRHPHLWAYLYDLSDHAPRQGWFSRMRRAVERLNTRALHAHIRAQAPDAIVCTHFLPAELLARRIAHGEPLPPVWVQVTDYDVHRLWVQPGMRGYLVAADETASRLRGLLPDAPRIAVTGIPVMPPFAQAHDRAACAQRHGLDPARTTALVMTGGAGIASGAAMVERLLAIGGDLQIVALAGRNAGLLAEYQRLAAAHPQRLHAIGYTQAVDELMACADVAVTKPGGLSVSECLSMSLPMILIAPIPGQELRNAHHLLEQGAALLALDAAALEYRIGRLLHEPELAARLRARCRALRRPDAAVRVLEEVLADGAR